MQLTLFKLAPVREVKLPKNWKTDHASYLNSRASL